MAPPRIGLLGGTFDPPHIGHLVVGEVARVALGLGELQFVVAGEPWMKVRSSSAEDRCRMVELAIVDSSDFRLNRSEIDRAGPTYTVDTLRELATERPDAELVFLAGADAISRLPDWHEAEANLELATFVALSRPGYGLDLAGPMLGRVEELTVPAIDISSTELRRRFRDGEAVRYQLPLSVEAYVRERGLYGAGPCP